MIQRVNLVTRCLLLVSTTMVACKPVTNEEQKNIITEYCFEISNNTGIAIRGVDMTPEDFAKQEPTVRSVINGPYYVKDKDDKTEGTAYLAEEWQFASERPKDIRGYFIVNREGNSIKITETLEGKIQDHYLVIGTHPLLVVNGNVHSQAKERRYKSGVAYRSAIGTKLGKDICFVLTNDQVTMENWAGILQAENYQGAINLDGGPLSQMVLRDETEQLRVIGQGTQKTKLVIFSYNR